MVRLMDGRHPWSGTSSSGSNPNGASNHSRFIPATWVAYYYGDMGNTFGPNGLAIGSSHVLSSICFNPTFRPANSWLSSVFCSCR